MHCFYCKAIGATGSVALLDNDDRKHLFKTLRAELGNQVELTNGEGVFAVAEVIDGHKLRIVTAETAPPPPVRIHLFIAPPRRQKMDILLKQCAEVGVWSITPMLTERSVSAPEKDAVLDRWQTILLEGCKQSKNPFLPTIALPISFKAAVQQAAERRYRCFIGAVHASQQPEAINDPSITDAAWFVGPEGGFTPAEEEAMRQAGFAELRLGPWVLRVETAAVVGAAMLLRDLLAARQ